MAEHHLIGSFRVRNQFGSETLYVYRRQYEKGGGIAVEVYEMEAGNGLRPIFILSTNLYGAEPFPLQQNQFYAKLWGANESYRASLLNSGLFEDTGRRVKASDYATAEVWEICD